VFFAFFCLTRLTYGSLESVPKIHTSGALKQFYKEIDHSIKRTRSSANVEFNAASYEVVFDVNQLFCDMYDFPYNFEDQNNVDELTTKYGFTTNIKGRLQSMFPSSKTRSSIKHVRLFPMRTTSFGARFLEQKLIKSSESARVSRDRVYTYNQIHGYHLPTTECFHTSQIDHDKVNAILDEFCLDPIILSFA
jgi:hypothetical protein